MNKLYYDSAYIKEFEAQVLSCQEGKKGWEITLSATAFYPEGGGQPADTGLLGNVRVTDVHEKDGQVVHYTDGPLPVGEMVRGVIDWDRRFQHMQEHSGEHLVSGLIHQRFGYDNVGFHMGTDEVTIDFNGVLEWGDLMAIEEKANGMIWENLEISAVYPEKDELDAMEYRSKKELTGAVRIVSIPGGDVCACCGTHVERTGEIGLVKFLSMIHYKGGVRISLLCGKRAVEDYERKRDQVQKISVLLSARPGEIARAVEKLKDEEAKLQEKLVAAYDKLLASEVRGIKEGDGDIFILEPDFEAIQLRHLVNRLLEEKKGRTVLALGGAAEGSFLYVLGSRDGDMRRLSRELNGLLNGRGGGSAQMAQGTFFATKDQLQAILKEKGFMSPVPCN
ncbi:MAG: alanyl-tRNA editing protein [Lachnospiraceae bacterium]|nr:alanyl-tRNA editing protein [Lachnospiraceae bacterium]